MKTNQEIMKEVADANIYAVNRKIEEAPFDKIMTGIVKSNGEDKGTYNVEINGELYENIPSFITVNINDTVKVCYPQNNTNQKFILGKYGQDEEIFKKINNLNDKLNSSIFKGVLTNADEAEINGIYVMTPDTNMGTSGLTANFGVIICFGFPSIPENTWRWQKAYYVGGFSGGSRTKVNLNPWTNWESF